MQASPLMDSRMSKQSSCSSCSKVIQMFVLFKILCFSYHYSTIHKQFKKYGTRHFFDQNGAGRHLNILCRCDKQAFIKFMDFMESSEELNRCT